MSNQKQAQKVIEEEIKELLEATIGEMVQTEIDTTDEQSVETSKFISKDDVIAIITSAKARASRTFACVSGFVICQFSSK